MQRCEHLAGCFFLDSLVEEDSELASFFRTLYCLADFSRCARYEAAMDLGREQVPADIFPNEKELVSLFTPCPGRLPR
ncbi:hypothetical protein ACUUL3_00785 [Thiovibrio sp. JS02]